MVDKKKESDNLPDIDSAWDADESGVSERPTLTPPFDLDRYAKRSERKLATDTAPTVPPPPESTARPSKPPSRGPSQDPLALANSNVSLGPPQLGTQASEEGSALDLVDRKAASETPAQGADPLIEMRERFALGDYSGALVMADSLLEDNPTNPEAREYAESCRKVLQQMYTARIGPLDRVPVVEVARDQLRWLSIDHRAGFVLSLVDGVSSLEMILDVSGMPTLDALRILYELVQQRIISFRSD